MNESVRNSAAFTWDFFIAHAGSDLSAAKELYGLMVSRCRVFLDSQCLQLGDDWDVELPKAQRQSRVTVALISTQTESAHYERDEIANAISMARANSNLHRVVPVFLEGHVPVGGDIPSGLRTKHGIALGKDGLPGVARRLLDLLAKLDGKHPEPASSAGGTEGLEAARKIAARIGYQNVGKSRKALEELIVLIRRGNSPLVKEFATNTMKELILFLGDLEGVIVPTGVRQMRKLALDVIKASSPGSLGHNFQDRELEYLDLYGMNFAQENLSHVSFRGCFLATADFQSSDLTGATFAEARIRNTKFGGANLTGADLGGADWFNASGLTEAQLRTVQPGTLLRCPSDVEEMHRFLKGYYALPFESWSADVQDHLRRTWSEYLRPGGLRDFLTTVTNAP